jgi:tetratricopeptide (TPR) repeat protein
MSDAPSPLDVFLAELKRRKVYRVAVAYAAVGFVLWQAAEIAVPALGLPEWVLTFVVVASLVGFPVAVVLAWFFEVRREEEAGSEGAVSAADIVADRALRRRFVVLAVAGAVVAIAAAGVVTLIRPPAARAGLLQEGARVVLADFTSQTGVEQVARAVTEWFRTDFARSEHLVLVTSERVARALERMRVDDADGLSTDRAREIAVRDGYAATLEGNVEAVGSGWLLIVQLVEPESGRIIDSENEAIPDSVELPTAIGRVSARLRERAGESLQSVRTAPPLPEVTTRSIEALAAYAQARDEFAVGRGRVIEARLQEAIALDPEFAMAHQLLGVLYRNWVRRSDAIRHLQTAYDLRDRMPARERVALTGGYHEYVTLDFDQARAAWREVAERDPARSETGYLMLGLVELRDGRYAAAESALVRSIEVYPGPGHARMNLVDAQLLQGKIDEAYATMDEMDADEGIRRRALVQLREYEEVERQLLDSLSAASDPRRQRDLEGQLAWVSLGRGKYEVFTRLWGKRLTETRDQGNLPFAVSQQVWDLARADLLVRNDTAGAISRALEPFPAVGVEPPLTVPPVELRVAQFWAHAGEAERARSHLARFDSIVPENEVPQWVKHRLEVEGRIELAEGNGDRAIRTLARAVEAPLAVFGCTQCPVVALGEAYDALGQVHEAIARYEQFLDSRAMYSQENVLDPLYLARTEERVGQLYEQLGDTTRAVEHHQAFVDLWRDADPELQPRVEAARQAIQRLSR